MTSRDRQATPAPVSLRNLRLRLTAWYAATFSGILFLLSAGMFAAITHRFDRDLDASLRDSAGELIRVARLRANASGAPLSMLDSSDLRIPGRTLYLLDPSGRSIAGAPPPLWVQELARHAATAGPSDHTEHIESEGANAERLLRSHAAPFTVRNGPLLVAVATADEIELEDRYTSLIAAFGGAALVAIVLVAAGGWLLARQSTAPVERSIEQMRRFMADAAHELRTPLTVLRSRAEVALQRPRETSEYVKALNGMQREAERLGRIVEDLLMLARADAGERPIERRRMFLDDVTLDAAEAARAIAERRSVRLEVDQFEEAAIDADPALVRQLVIILLDNAIKFTPAGGVVRIAVHAGPTQATLTVSDTGVGIAADQLPHVFDRFYRGDPARTRDGETGASASDGVGLGLSIARWIAGEHGAELHIESQLGQGTQVTVRFAPAGQGTLVSSS